MSSSTGLVAVQTPFQLLSDIAQRSRQHAVGLPSQIELKTYWSGIGFVLGGRRYVAPLDEIAEILSVPSYTQLPGVVSWVKGVANVRGRLLPIMDLGELLEQALGARRAKRRILVVERGDIYSGLVVEAVLGMQHFVTDSFDASIREDAPEEVQPFLAGTYHRSGVWQVFSLFALIENEKFLQVAV